MGVIRLMGIDDVSIGVCLTGCVWFDGKPKVRRGVFVRLVGTPIRALCFWSWYCRIFDTALCTFRSRSGSLHGAAWSVLAERRRNEASSSREGGERLAVRCWLAFGVGCSRGMRAVRASVSWPARLAGLRKRSEAESSAYEGSFPLNSADRLSGMKA